MNPSCNHSRSYMCSAAKLGIPLRYSLYIKSQTGTELYAGILYNNARVAFYTCLSVSCSLVRTTRIT